MHYTNILIAASLVHSLRNYLVIASTPPPPVRTTNHHCDRGTTTTIQQTKSTVKNILGIIQRHQNLISMRKDANRVHDNAFHSPLDDARPYVCISFAQTINGHIATTTRGISCSTSAGDTSSSTSASTTKADGKMSTVTSSTSSNLKLSSPESFLLTHALRSKFDAILIGGNTLSSDNPRLNNRLWSDQQDDEDNGDHGEENSLQTTMSRNHISSQPIPVVLDTHLNHVMTFIRRDQIVSLSCAKSHPFVIVCCSQQAYDDHYKEILEYCTRCNVCIKLQPCQCNPKTCHLDIENVVYQLRQKHGIQSIMVEGGASILSSFLVHYRYLVDCICITICPKFIAKHGLNALTNEHGHEELEDLSSSFTSHWYPLGPDCIYLGVKTHDPI
jgi:Pyrimidine reductase, riboflavin biosynthesis